MKLALLNKINKESAMKADSSNKFMFSDGIVSSEDHLSGCKPIWWSLFFSAFFLVIYTISIKLTKDLAL
jgi:hypothetical protein